MTTATLLTLVLCISTLVVLGVVVIFLLRSSRAQARRTEAALEQARTEAAELRARLDALTVAAAAPMVEEFVITDLGSEPEPAPVAQRIDGRLFLDIVARESVVKAAAFGHGVRQTFTPENRNRISFAMKREVKRRRKERRGIVRDLKREAALRQRMARDLHTGESA
jgi:signal transduction histidine kinase